ncbi:nucleotide-binding protein [Methanomicrobiaceae archaeon CYW5]|uniref:nucleotide-binding protein n=1 Tax=Methanovulcanius yangii TaxID=1789227 RepID=UPI0029CA6B0A|nr:nucleotide-binding protein [Methanovulcanius yangii]MBT8507836.1 nucleotide-binding protein [Methanovulcanius yangii]
MEIKGTRVQVSIIHIVMFVIFTLFLSLYVVLTGDYGTLFWGIPVLIMLLVIPIVLNYMSRQEYDQLIPSYEAEAKLTRISSIKPADIGKIVKIEGVVERALFKSLNRPQFMVADKSGEISVKMFTSASEDIRKDDVVEVLGQVIKRYVVVGDPVVNAVSIKKIRKDKKNN